jgi:hypothetical protein
MKLGLTGEVISMGKFLSYIVVSSKLEQINEKKAIEFQNRMKLFKENQKARNKVNEDKSF